MEVLLIQAEHEFRRLQVNAVDIQIISVLHFRAMELAAAHEQVDEAGGVRKSRLLDGRDELCGASRQKFLSAVQISKGCGDGWVFIFIHDVANSRSFQSFSKNHMHCVLSHHGLMSSKSQPGKVHSIE